MADLKLFEFGGLAAEASRRGLYDGEQRIQRVAVVPTGPG